MTWAPLLLAERSPCLRWLVLRDIFRRPEGDSELAELSGLRRTDPLVADLLALQDEDGSWRGADPVGRGDRIRATGLALARLGYLGFDVGFPPVRKGAEYLFSKQRKDGAWPIPLYDDDEESEGLSMVPLQTALPLRGLAACGCYDDPRAERAYDWLVSKRLDDGAWPTGLASGTLRGVGGYRRLAHSRWGCRSNTTGALVCLAHHPRRRRGPEARRALDLILGRETRDRRALGFEVARLIGEEPARGILTFFARYDIALVLDLCRRIGASGEDERVGVLVDFVRNRRGPYGLWDYEPKPQASRWVTFDILRSLTCLEAAEGGPSDWLSFEPRTPFQAYPAGRRRF